MTKNDILWEKAKRIFPGGVNSPVRAFKAVGGTPIVFESGKGSKLTSVDGKEYIDYVGAWGPQILGHAHPAITEAIKKAASNSASFGASCNLEIELGEKILSSIPSIEIIRFVNSGTEAAMSALRLARGFTGRNKIIKFAGCYHGHADFLLVKAGSGAMTFGTPDSKGVPESYASETLIARYNDINDVDRIIKMHEKEIAGIILEPVVGNMGVVLPEKDFIEGLRSRCDKIGALLIFDEVMTGFRVSRSCAQGLFGIKPDLTCLGKIIGGGLPIGAYGGRREIMEQLSPLGPVYQAGTNSGNPVVMAAGSAALENLTPTVYEKLEHLSNMLEKGFKKFSKRKILIQRCGSMMTLFFVNDAEARIRSADDLDIVDRKIYGEYFQHMLKNGIYLPPSQFEAFFVSAAHSEEDISRTIEAFSKF